MSQVEKVVVKRKKGKSPPQGKGEKKKKSRGGEGAHLQALHLRK